MGKADRTTNLIIKELDLLLISVFLCSTLFLFGPIQLYLSNINELWFDFSQVLIVSIISLFIVTIVVFLLGLFVNKWNRWSIYYKFFLFGVGVALYIQGNFIPFRYGLLNGTQVDWNEHFKLGLEDALLWVIVLIIPAILQKRLKGKAVGFIRVVSIFLIITQLIGVSSQLMVADFSKKAERDSYISQSGLYEVSGLKNVIIFILDTYDQKVFESICEEDKEKVSFLDGFTYYSNMTCAYPQTKGALPFILTGEYYENKEPYLEYIEKAWRNDSGYYDELKQQNFLVQIYTDIGISKAAAAKVIDNNVEAQIKVSSWLSFEKDLVQLTLLKYLPDLLKRFVWREDSFFSNLKVAEGEQPFSWDVENFFRCLNENGLTINNEHNEYKVIHLEGVHPPFNLSEDFLDCEKSTSIEEEGLANLHVLKDYFKQLKEVNAYDDSLIIVTGDHGFSAAKSNPIMLVKGFGETHPLAFDDSPVSHANLQATVMKAIGISGGEYGEAIGETMGSTAMRRYLQYSWSFGMDDKAYLPDMSEYLIMPRGNESEDYILTGRRFSSSGVISDDAFKCTVGKPITFNNGIGCSYFINGIDAFSNNYVNDAGETVYWNWSNDYESDACFFFGEEKKDLLCKIKLAGAQGLQHVVISSGDKILLDDSVPATPYMISFAVPRDCIEEGRLLLHFDFPSALPGSEKDGRVFALAFEEIVFEELY